MSAFARAADPWGRPLDVRVAAVAVVEGAIEGGDARGDLWASHVPGPYRRLTLASGAYVYVSADLSRDLLTALGV